MPTWRARLGTALFGQDSRKPQSERGRTVNDGVHGEEEASTAATSQADSVSIAADRDGRKTLEASRADTENSTTALAPPSPATLTAANKRRSLQALLGSSVDDRAGAPQSGLAAPIRVPSATERFAPRPSMGQRKASSDDRSDPAAPASSSSSLQPKPSPSSSPSLSTSLTQGVKTLSEKLANKKEASEAFKTMREQRSSSPLPSSDRGVALSHSSSSSDMSSGARPSVPQENAVNLEEDDAAPKQGAATSSTSKADSCQTADGTPQEASEVRIPVRLVDGEPMLKVTSKKVKQRIVHIDPDAGQILWDSKKNNRVDFEAIREVRVGSDARTHRTSLSIAGAHESRWISIIYQAAGIYKALHMIALTDESLSRWRDTLAAVQEERRLLASGADMAEQRQSMWLRRHFKSADASRDARLDFEEVVKMCRRLGIMSNRLDLRNRFDEADKSSSGFLDFASFQHFVGLLKRRPEVEKLFDTWADERHDEGGATMGQARFVEFLRTEQGLKHASDGAMLDVFKKFRGEGRSCMELDGFLAYLVSSDNSLLSDQSALAMSRSNGLGSDEGSTSDAQQYRAQAKTAEELIAISGQARVTHDMSRPLAEYYISSSHNTYLVGGQLTGESTSEGYVRALMQGARSVELDCWDGPNNEPVVTHGRTLTSKVPLRDVIEAIGRYAFVASPYPLILSLEIHNDLAQQNVVADILRTVLGDKLLCEPLPRTSGDTQAHAEVLPTPQQMMGKILVKTKNLLLAQGKESSESGDKFVQAEKGSTSATTDTTDTDNDGFLHNARDLVRSVTKRRSTSSNRREGGSNGGKDKQVPMSPALTSLLIYTIGVKHRGINKKESYAVEHMISLSERSATKYAKSAAGGPNRDDLIKHNRTHLTRIYPSMHSFARLSYSANFLPCLFWSMGCQLVALNWQTADLGFEMNQAMFARNGRSGYVLKPDALRQKEQMASKAAGGGGGSIAPLYVVAEVTIISAQQLPRSREGTGTTTTTSSGSSDSQSHTDDVPVINPFVSVAVHVPDSAQAFGVAAVTDDYLPNTGLALSSSQTDTASLSAEGAAAKVSASPRKMRTTTRLRTTTVRQNGFNPIWDETLTFRIRLPASSTAATADAATEGDDVQRAARGLLDLCFLRFEARNESKLDSGSGVGGADGRSRSGSVSASNTQDRRDAATVKLTRPVSSSTLAAPTAAHGDAAAAATADNAKARRRISQSESSTSDASINDDNPCLASYMISLGAMEQGYHHVPLHDGSMTQHLFSTLFVKTKLRIDRGGQAG